MFGEAIENRLPTLPLLLNRMALISVKCFTNGHAVPPR